VAIARALATNVDLILADEPTGNLDETSSEEIVQVFKTLAHEHGKCVIVVTHAAEIAREADEVLTLSKGALGAAVTGVGAVPGAVLPGAGVPPSVGVAAVPGAVPPVAPSNVGAPPVAGTAVDAVPGVVPGVDAGVVPLSVPPSVPLRPSPSVSYDPSALPGAPRSVPPTLPPTDPPSF
jgi:energy-coupling factor transporter ATP-binding protein EcfA2